MKAKILFVLISRKFWTLVASLATTAGMFAGKQVTGPQALAAFVAAFAAYKLATAIEAARPDAGPVILTGTGPVVNTSPTVKP